ncbi:MAG: methicillin resistance protein [Microgenomates bacterium 39_7]|nr:MAG: methicillin resistance protein [Microgenomates bacterium 39_7]
MSNITFNYAKNKNDWEQYVSVHPQANFLQSYNWGLFHHNLGKKYFPVVIFNDKKQVGVAMIIKEEAKRGDYLTIAGGPLLDWQGEDTKQVFSEFVLFIYRLAQTHGCHFVRIRPQVEDSAFIRTLFKNNGFNKAPMHLTADRTLRLDLSMSEEELLKQMGKSTRYEIRKANKLDIETKIIKDVSFVDDFYDHQLYLAKKHNFIPFGHDFLQKQFEQFLVDDQVAFINSYHQGGLLASVFVIFYHQEAVYHYGVSTKANSKLPGSYAVQWAAIQEAKRRKCSIYNFWGVSPINEKKHRFAGPSLFKRGFGGDEVQHLWAHDLPISSWYPAIKIFEQLRKRARGL